jgi:hypothetical protein
MESKRERALMRRLLTTGLLLSAIAASAQTRPPAVPEVPETPAHLPDSTSTDLPDAPEPAQAQPEDVVAVAEASFKETGDGARTCGPSNSMKVVYFDPNRYGQVPKPCTELIYPYQRFLTTDIIIPLTWQQKGYTALHNLADPFNFATILGISAITIGTDSHSAYGPGMKGFGKIVGVSFSQDAIGQFFGVFTIPVLVHQDPRYLRMPHAPIPKRILYSISRTVVSRSDDGRSIPNYATLLTYPIGAELGNLYVPGIATNGVSTFTRILTGYALDPANNLLTEFLPDVASRLHVRIIFVQRILNNIASEGASQP